MAAYISAELSGTNGAGGSILTAAASPSYRPRATVYGARLKRLRATFTLGATAVGATDTLTVGNLPAGSTFAFGMLTASASMGASATLAIGTSAATGKYRTAATFTATDTPTPFGNTAAVGVADPENAAESTVLVTVAVAALPTSGTLVVDLYYSLPN
jgi:hypothetical protein